MRTEPSDQSPCPDQMVKYECRIQTPVNTLTWTLPTGDDLEEFSGFEDVGTVKMEGSFTGTLTGVISSNFSSRFLLNSTIVFLVSMNNSVLTCFGVVGGTRVEDSTTVTLSGDYCTCTK